MSRADTRPSPDRPGRLSRVWIRFWDWPWWGRVSTVLGILVALISLGVFLENRINPDPSPPLELGEEGTTGSFAVQVRSVECGKSRQNIPPTELQKMIQAGIPESLFDRGQLCFADTRLRNTSETQLPARVLAVLQVGDREFPLLTAFPFEVPFVFPDESASVSIVFQIPSEASPTKI